MGDLGSIKYIVIDVDGTLTSGGIYYDDHGNEMKKFNTRDGAGFFAAHEAGLKMIVLTGRSSPLVARRMQEMKVDIVEQGVHNKEQWLRVFMQENSLSLPEVAFIGDELNDMAAMRLVGYVACPQDACPEVKSVAHYICPHKGGEGAFRDFIHFLLESRGQWDSAVKAVYGF